MQNRKPMILVLAGPNGSGKSTITTFFDKVGKYTNADDVVASTGMNNMEAAVMVDRMRYESIAKKEDFTLRDIGENALWKFLLVQKNSICLLHFSKTPLIISLSGAETHECGARW